MKMVFMVHNEYFAPRVMQLLTEAGVDYYTRWDHAQGKGHGTDPNLGTGTFAATNAVVMIAFQDEAVLEGLIQIVTRANQEIARANDKIRMFQLPLDRVV
jgi:hypothetical protein